MSRAGRIAVGIALGAFVLAGVGAWLWPRSQPVSIDYKIPGNPGPKIIGAKAAAIERRERVIEQTVWAKELDAQRHGRVFEDFWDALNSTTNKWQTISNFKFEILSLPSANFSPTAWHNYIENAQSAGWRLMQSEFRHNAFDPATNAQPAHSTFWFSAHLTNSLSPARAILRGDIQVTWASANEVAAIDATKLEIIKTEAPTLFTPLIADRFDAPVDNMSVEPIIVRDLDGDGSLEIIVAGANVVYRRDGVRYVTNRFCAYPPRAIYSGLIEDFDSDGNDDFLFAAPDGLFLIAGSSGGKFDGVARRVSPAGMRFRSPRTLTCGDIDGDGDLDIFIGQYKGPFADGSMPTPYYDANNSYPSYLLVNDGHGNFSESKAPLHANRHVYAASFVDLDGDAQLDLVVTSDFAGVDIYRNEGHGEFREITSHWIGERHAFGMAHAFADFNSDGVLDFLVIGMNSPTANRLEHLGLNRPSSKLAPTMRRAMIAGNRLFLGRPGGSFLESAAPSLQRVGWGWGVAAADFNNDGWDDAYIATGMETGTTVRDYDSEFWLHDIYIGSSNPDQVANQYFASKGARTRGKGMSYGGYEKNRLYLNQSGTNYFECAHLFGLAEQADSRNVIAADLDNDGRLDLIFTTLHPGDAANMVFAYRNEMQPTNNWIAINLVGKSAIGSTITVRSGTQTWIKTIATGDSFRSQSPPIAHFGLGQRMKVDEVKIRWPGGAESRIAGPEMNKVHNVSEPRQK